MDPALLTTLPAMLSADRFATYLAACGSQVDQAVRLYTWNIEAASAFWGPLHAFEVVLRNALNDQLTAQFRRPDWWAAPGVQLTRIMNDQLQHALVDAAKVATRKGRAQVPGDVVAAFTLGFWVGLTGKGGAGLQYETRYWQPALVKAFPHYAGKRGALNRDLDSVRLFRNRVAHHEPIFTRHLQADHDTLLRLAGLVSTDAATYISTHSRVPAVLAKRPAAVTTGQNTSF